MTTYAAPEQSTLYESTPIAPPEPAPMPAPQRPFGLDPRGFRDPHLGRRLGGSTREWDRYHRDRETVQKRTDTAEARAVADAAKTDEREAKERSYTDILARGEEPAQLDQGTNRYYARTDPATGQPAKRSYSMERPDPVTGGKVEVKRGPDGKMAVERPKPAALRRNPADPNDWNLYRDGAKIDPVRGLRDADATVQTESASVLREKRLADIAREHEDARLALSDPKYDAATPTDVKKAREVLPEQRTPEEAALVALGDEKQALGQRAFESAKERSRVSRLGLPEWTQEALRHHADDAELAASEGAEAAQKRLATQQADLQGQHDALAARADAWEAEQSRGVPAAGFEAHAREGADIRSTAEALDAIGADVQQQSEAAGKAVAERKVELEQRAKDKAVMETWQRISSGMLPSSARAAPTMQPVAETTPAPDARPFRPSEDLPATALGDKVQPSGFTTTPAVDESGATVAQTRMAYDFPEMHLGRLHDAVASDELKGKDVFIRRERGGKVPVSQDAGGRPVKLLTEAEVAAGGMGDNGAGGFKGREMDVRKVRSLGAAEADRVTAKAQVWAHDMHQAVASGQATPEGAAEMYAAQTAELDGDLARLRKLMLKGAAPANRYLEAWKAAGNDMRPTPNVYDVVNAVGDPKSQDKAVQQARMDALVAYAKEYRTTALYDEEAVTVLQGDQQLKLTRETLRAEGFWKNFGREAANMIQGTWEGIKSTRVAWNVMTGDEAEAAELQKGVLASQKEIAERGSIGTSDPFGPGISSGSDWLAFTRNSAIAVLPSAVEMYATGGLGRVVAGAKTLQGMRAVRGLGVAGHAAEMVAKGGVKTIDEAVKLTRAALVAEKGVGAVTKSVADHALQRARGFGMKAGAGAASVRANTAEYLSDAYGSMTTEEFVANPEKVKRMTHGALVAGVIAGALDLADGVELGAISAIERAGLVQAKAGMVKSAARVMGSLGAAGGKEAHTGLWQGVLGVLSRRYGNGQALDTPFTDAEVHESFESALGEAFGGVTMKGGGDAIGYLRGKYQAWKAGKAVRVAQEMAAGVNVPREVEAVLEASREAEAEAIERGDNAAVIHERGRQKALYDGLRGSAEAREAFMAGVEAEIAAAPVEMQPAARGMAAVLAGGDVETMTDGELAGIGLERKLGGKISRVKDAPVYVDQLADGRWIVTDAGMAAAERVAPSLAGLRGQSESEMRAEAVNPAKQPADVPVDSSKTPAPKAPTPAKTPDQPVETPKTPAKTPVEPPDSSKTTGTEQEFAVSVKGEKEPRIVKAKTEAEALAKVAKKGKTVTGVEKISGAEQSGGAAEEPTGEDAAPKPEAAGGKAGPEVPSGAANPPGGAEGLSEKQPTISDSQTGQTKKNAGQHMAAARQQLGKLTPEQSKALERFFGAAGGFLPAFERFFSDVVWTNQPRNTGGFQYYPEADPTGEHGLVVPKANTLILSLADIARWQGEANDARKWALAGISEEGIHAIVEPMIEQVIALVNQLKSEAPKTYATFRAAYKGAKTEKQQAHELIRMIVQGRIVVDVDGVKIDRKLTEEQFPPTLLAKLREILDKVVAAIRDLAAQIAGGKPHPVAKALIEMADKVAARMDALMANEKDSQFRPKPRTESVDEAAPKSPATPAMTSQANAKSPKSSTQFTLSAKDAAPFVEFAQSIPDEEVYHSESDAFDDYGVETEPHVTALYGLLEHDPRKAAALLRRHGPVGFTTGKMSIFENDEYDVLKVEVTGPELHALNKKLQGLPHFSTFPDYKPHMTLAYLKKGEGKKYVGDARFEGKKFTFDSLTFSPPSDVRKLTGRTEIPLAKSPATPAVDDPTLRGIAAADTVDDLKARANQRGLRFVSEIPGVSHTFSFTRADGAKMEVSFRDDGPRDPSRVLAGKQPPNRFVPVVRQPATESPSPAANEGGADAEPVPTGAPPTGLTEGAGNEDDFKPDLERRTIYTTHLARWLVRRSPEMDKVQGAAEKTAMHVVHAAVTGKYSSILHPDNKNARALFRELTGQTLGKSLKATQDAFIGIPFDMKGEPKVPSEIESYSSPDIRERELRAMRGKKIRLPDGTVGEASANFGISRDGDSIVILLGQTHLWINSGMAHAGMRAEETAAEAAPAPPKPARTNEEQQKTYSQFKRALTKAENAKDWPAVIAQAKAFNDYYEQSGDPFPDDWNRWVRAGEDAERALRLNPPLVVPITKPLVPAKPALTPAQQKMADILAKAKAMKDKGISSQKMGQSYTEPIPGALRNDAIAAAGEMFDEGMNTPEAVAAMLAGLDMAEYSQAVWNALLVSMPENENSRPPWAEIYSALDNAAGSPTDTQDETGTSTGNQGGVGPDSGGVAGSDTADDADDGLLEGPPSEDVETPGSGQSGGGLRPGNAGKGGGSKGGTSGTKSGGRGKPGSSGSAGKPDGTGKGTGSGDGAGVTEPEINPGRPNYFLEDPEAIVGGGPKARFARNQRAIETWHNLTGANREPTAEELDTLAAYMGWGAFGQELFKGTWDRPQPKQGWEKEDQWLRDHLGRKEWEGLQTSIINAHYTDPPTVTAMWDIVRKLGFTGGRVLEPSMGIGNFFGLMPRDLEAYSSLTGIEMDLVTGGMAKLLYPKANVQIKPYQHSKTSDNFYDLIIGNWPFFEQGPADRRYDKIGATLHDYFFLKALDQVRPGGFVIGITSAGSMDKKGQRARYEMAKKGELVAAFRLPSGAFEKYAGTAVVTDILIFKKRETPGNPDGSGFLNTVEVQTDTGKVEINEYFAKNPQNILGKLGYGHGTTTFRPGMIVTRPDDLLERLQNLPAILPAGAAFTERAGQDKKDGYISNNMDDRQGSVVDRDGKLWTVDGEHLRPLEEKVKYAVKDAKRTAKRVEQMKRLYHLRRVLGRVLDDQRMGRDATASRKQLNALYDAFVKDHGAINTTDGLKILYKADDPFAATLANLESNVDGKWRKRDIFTKDILRGVKKMENPSIADAYVLARNDALQLDMQKIADHAKVSHEEAETFLVGGGHAFKTPVGTYEPKDIYLAGNVRQKHREAVDAKEQGVEGMDGNIAALEGVIPKDIPYFQIEAQIGATWVTSADYTEFSHHLLSASDGIDIVRVPSGWMVRMENKDLGRKAEATTQWGVPYYSFRKILSAAMNNATLRITYKDDDGVTHVNEKQTAEVNAKVEAIREEFTNWIWSDPDRASRLETNYNEVFNSIAIPQYDGSHLAFEGLVLEKGDKAFNLRKHQMDAVWRGVLTGRSLNAHEVGTGKTLVMAGLAMESRRLGRARKPLIFAHNANSRQVAAEIQAAYPGGRVLFVDNLSADTRAQTMAQIALDDWDAVVVPHSLIDRMSLRPESVEAIVAETLRELEQAAIEAAAEDDVDLSVEDMDDPEAMRKKRSPTAKQMVKEREKIKRLIEKARLLADRPDSIFFEDMGVDMIMVDEAHIFKKLPISSLQKLKGLNKTGSGRGLMLSLLTDYVKRANGGGGVHLFTGTPVTNTLNEVYNMMRYFMDDVMGRDGLKRWDDWFNAFATSTSEVELNSAGEWDTVERLASFVNLPELRRMIGQYLDIVFADDMPEFQPRDSHEGRTEDAIGRPFKKVINAIGDMSPAQKRHKEELRARYKRWNAMTGLQKKDAMRHGAPEVPIIIEGEGVKAALDMRLINPGEPDHANSKISRAVKNIMTHFREHDKSTQMVFMQTGFSDFAERSGGPSMGGRKPPTIRVAVFNVAKDLKRRLIEEGVPEEQIAIFSDMDAEERKIAAEKMQRGEIRVAIGSTETMGTGVNAQIEMRAMHHLDAPWMPGDLEQRNGRGWRQGNRWNTVFEYRYIAEGSHDGRRWQILLTKDRFIKKFLKADDSLRVIEGDGVDLDDEGGGGMEETFAAAAGDPRILRREKLKKDVDKLNNKERAHVQALAAAGRKIGQLTADAARERQDMPAREEDARLYAGEREKDFSMTVGKETFTETDAANDALLAIMDRVPIQDDFVKDTAENSTKVGHYRGFDIVVFRFKTPLGVRANLYLKGKLRHEFNSVSRGSMDYTLRGIETYIANAEKQVAEWEKSIENLTKLRETPFGRAADLARKQKQLEDITRDIEQNPTPAPSWLRIGAPVGSSVYLSGTEYAVAGHRVADGTFYVQVETESDTLNFDYRTVTNEDGIPLFDAEGPDATLDIGGFPLPGATPEAADNDQQNPDSFGGATSSQSPADFDPLGEGAISSQSPAEFFRAGQDPDDFEGKSPSVNWDAQDNYGVAWNEDTVPKHLKKPKGWAYPAMLDASELNPKLVELEEASEIRRMKEDQFREEYAHEFTGETHFEGDDEVESEDWREVRDRVADDAEASWESNKQEMAHPFRGGYPPAVVIRTGKDTYEVVDGNHRIALWQEQGFDVIPAFVYDEYLQASIDPLGEAGNTPISSQSPADFAIPSDDTVRNAIETNKRDRVGAARTLAPGTPVGIRLDLPAQTRHGVYVATIHHKGTKSSVGKVIGYDGIARIKNAVFWSNQKESLKIHDGDNRAPIATVEGEFDPSREMPAGDWVAVGFNPKKHAYFYDRESGRPVIGSDEAVLVGPSVWAKNPKYGDTGDFLYTQNPADWQKEDEEFHANLDALVNDGRQGKAIGDPSRAYSMIDEQMRAVDQFINETATPETRAQWRKEGDWLENSLGGPQAARHKLLQKAKSGATLTPQETALYTKYWNQATSTAGIRTQKDIDFARELYFAYRYSRRGTAQTMSAGVDQFMTPAQRMHFWLTGIALEPDDAAKKQAAKKREQAKKADTPKQADDLRKEADDIERESARKMKDKLEADLKKSGFTLDEWLNTNVRITKDAPLFHRMLNAMAEWKQRTMKRLQGGDVPFKRVAKELGKTEKEVRAVREEFEKQFRAFVAAQWQPGMTADELIALTKAGGAVPISSQAFGFNIGPVFHASPNKFATFDTAREGAHFGTMEQASNLRGKGPTKTRAYYLSLHNPLRISDVGVFSNFINLFSNLSRSNVLSHTEADKVWAEWQKSDDLGWTALKGALRAKGYDGLVYENEVEGSGDSYVVFDSDQIKAAPSHPISSQPPASDSAMEAIIQEAMMKMGLVPPDKQGKARKVSRRGGKRAPLDPDTVARMTLGRWKNRGTKNPSSVAEAVRDYAKENDASAEAHEALRDRLIALGVSAANASEMADLAHERLRAHRFGESADYITYLDTNDAEQVIAAAKAMGAARGDALDMIREYWYASVLSGPKTQVVNLASYPIHGLWNMGVQRGLSSLLNSAFGVVGAGNDMAPQLGDLGVMWKAAAPGLADALRLAVKSWKTGTDFLAFDKLHDKQGTSRDEISEIMTVIKTMGLEVPAAAIPGKTGQFIRTPMRGMQFADVLGKTIIAHMEAAGHALRIARRDQKAAGTKFASKAARQADLEGRMTAALNTVGGEAWKFAIREAVEAGFQTPLDGGPAPTNAVDKVERALAGVLGKIDSALQRRGHGTTGFVADAAKMVVKLLLIPFVRTPYNIMRIGLRKSPLGMLPFVVRTLEAGLMGMMGKKGFHAVYGKFFEHLAEQTLAWGLGYGLLRAMTEGDDDDDDKPILITGGPLPGRGDRAENLARLERSGGDFIIRVGGKDGVKFAYGRFEPIGTVLGTTIDMLRGTKMDDDVTAGEKTNRVIGGMMGQVEQKTFLRGASDLIDLVDAVRYEKPDKLTNYGLRVATTIVPNIIKAPIRDTDDWLREYSTASASYKFLPLPDSAEPKILPATGKEAVKEGNDVTQLLVPVGIKTGELAPHVLAITNYNAGRPGRPFKDGGMWAPDVPSRTLKGHRDGDIELKPQVYTFLVRSTAAEAARTLAGRISLEEAKHPTQKTIERIKDAYESAAAKVREGLKRQPATTLAANG